ncbi:hypothetical protein PhCBS80983_g01920 [Powellomyces hirtus]|uniref:Uncharacterized protein n=1 Tax=Powellomyces hirtus TaxID=109895 RepID=A0A507EA25_9FUNG|nr:hypothetical protein PhCBS80983_g01920 [Powellomyces hirtus]
MPGTSTAADAAEIGEAGYAIGDLAKDTARKDKRASRFAGIPLVFLAPLLVALALAGTLVPNTVILTRASRDSVEELGGRFLGVLLEDVRVKTEAPIKALEPVLYMIADMPEVNETFSRPLPYYGLRYTNLTSTLVIIKERFHLDLVVGYKVGWKSGYGLTNAVIDPKTGLTTVAYAHHAWVQPINDPISGKTVVSIVDADVAYNWTRSYIPDPYTYRLNPAANYSGLYPLPNEIPGTGSMMLGIVPPEKIPRRPFVKFSAHFAGMKTAYISLMKFPNEAAAVPTYAISVGVLVDGTWNQMLRATKPVENSVVAIFNSNLDIQTSSNMILNGTNTNRNGVLTFASAKADEHTLQLRAALIERFGTFAVAKAATQTSPSFRIEMDGETWIVGMTLAAMGTYDSALLVAAIPRSEVYGRIDAASSKSRGITIGIAVGMSIVVCGIFVMVVLPLAALARQMEDLTKLNFGNLESSGALDKRSFILELRRVQIVFATMVKAFAGAIKKNKALVNKDFANKTSQPSNPGNASVSHRTSSNKALVD